MNRENAVRTPLVSKLWDDVVERLTAPALTCDPKYRELGPIEWAVERLGVPRASLVWSAAGPEYATHRWDGTRDPMTAIARALCDWRNCAVESATGTGKTYFAAIIVLWFLDCYEGATVVTTAPKEAQLRLHMWKEIRRLWPRFQRLHPAAELTNLRIRMRPLDDSWAAHGFACGVGADEESATKAQGFHAEYMLVITEETPGIDAAIMTAFENTCTWHTNIRLALGNPDAPHDQLHKMTEKEGVVAVRVSALDHPNVVTGRPIIPGAVGRQKVEERTKNYGKGSRLYESRVRGMCPTEGSDALFRYAWLRAAADRAKDPAFRQAAQKTGPHALGVDVANSENGDKAAIARGVGPLLEEIDSKPCPDANLLASERVLPLMQGYQIVDKNVGVDSVGVGVGTVNELKRLGRKIAVLNGGEQARPIARREEEYLNLRSQMYWQFRVDVETGEVGLPDDEELFSDLCAPTWTTRNGKIVVESKEALKKRLGRSPDKADAAVYWNWVRKSRGAASTGGALITI